MCTPPDLGPTLLAGALIGFALLGGCQSSLETPSIRAEGQPDTTLSLRNSALSPSDTTDARFDCVMREALSYVS